MGQPQTFRGRRGQTEISGVTYAQLYAIVRRKLDYFHPDKSDPDAFCQDMCCQVEKAQGIFPNVPALHASATEAREGGDPAGGFVDRGGIEWKRIARAALRHRATRQSPSHCASRPFRASVPSREWQPIETAPKDTFVLLFVPNGRLESGPVTMGLLVPPIEERDERGRFKRREWWPADWHGFLGTDGDNSPSWCEPTHWMPLPEPPASAMSAAPAGETPQGARSRRDDSATGVAGDAMKDSPDAS